jgi:DNA-binding NarL/FixJ family response regulator/GAF domain-containing protein
MDKDDSLRFPDFPRAELDRSLSQLVELAGDVLATQGRLRALLKANQAIVQQLDLPTVLRRIVDVAVELVGARYGALGVISPHGGLEQFITVGMTEAEIAHLGHLPEGHGLLGALVDDPRPIRLDHLQSDSRSTGYPEGHPPMDSFLGVPVRVRGEVYGNLYLSNQISGAFSEELVTALASTAGFAIDNARLFAETRRRQDWSAASAEITSALLSVDQSDAISLLATKVLELSDGDYVRVALPSDDPTHLVISTAAGLDEDRVEGRLVPLVGSIWGSVLDSKQPRLVEEEEMLGTLSTTDSNVGPTMALPLIGSGKTLGVLVVSRLAGRVRFTPADLELAADFAGQASLAMELANAKADQQRMVLLEDRGRIARDLHDHVIQQLFGTGLELQSVVGALPPGPTADRVDHAVSGLDTAIAQIRTAIFALSSSETDRADTVRHRIIDVVNEVAAGLPRTPHVAFAGPVDLAVTGALADDAVAVIRESLTNVVKHAAAQQTSVSVAVVHEAGTAPERTGEPRGPRPHLRRGFQLRIGTGQHPVPMARSVQRSSGRGTTMSDPIRVFLVDDHEIVRRGVGDLLDAEPDIEVVGEAGTAAQARSRIPVTHPDVALLDVRLPDGSGIDVCRELRVTMPDTHFLILTAYDDDQAMYAAVIAGASGYVLKDVRGSGLIDSVRQVAAGRSLLDPSLTRKAVERMKDTQHQDPRLAVLSVREREVLALIADGMTNRQIGENLSLAEKTVKNYVSSLLSKLGLQRRTQAVALQLDARTPDSY